MSYALHHLGQTPAPLPIPPPVQPAGFSPVPVWGRTPPGRYVYDAASPYIAIANSVQGKQQLWNVPIVVAGIGMTALGLAGIVTWVTKGRAAPTRVKVAAPLLVVAGWMGTALGVAPPFSM